MSIVANFTPTKRFFVEMLTRDIHLEDAILDLLDNSLDGVARSQGKNPEDIDYSGYWVKIKFNKKNFSIEDNCGGIPEENVDYAFRMGRPEDAPKEELATVGVYGIGMKRSIFKVGRHCVIETNHKENDAFKVEIDESWLASDSDWEIPLQNAMSFDENYGTKISISNLNPSIAKRFSGKDFNTSLVNKIIYAYSYIIAKGFEVLVNGEKINPNPVSIRYESKGGDGKAIQPYMYKANIDDVEVSLIVGFSAPLVTEKEEEEEKIEPKYRTENAGWTIVCNDRIVVYKDKTELTGWGEDFARYHTQFIAISGVVYFKSRYPEKLPITTTKRGVDITSSLFLKVRKHIIEGTKLFIDYTNKWKGEDLIKQSNERLSKTQSATPIEIMDKLWQEEESKIVNVQNRTSEQKYRPELPIPESHKMAGRRVVYTKSKDEIEFVCDYLGMDLNSTPSQIGEECFDFVMREASK